MAWNFIEMLLPPRGLDEDRNRIIRVIHSVCLFLTFLIFIPLYTNAGVGNWYAVNILLLEEVLLWFTLWLNYRGNLKWTIRLLMASLFIVTTLLIILAEDGSHDIAILIYPGSLVIAGILLSRRSYLIYAVVVILTFAMIMVAEVKGIIVTRLSAYASIRNTADMMIILSVIAFVVLFLIDNLRQSVARNKALLSALPDIVFRINREGMFLDFSAPRNQVLSVSPQEFIGKQITSVLPEPVASKTMAAVQTALEKKNVQQFEYELPVDNRKEYWEARVVAFQENEVVVVIRNITETKQAEEQRKLSEEKFSLVFMTNPDSLSLTRLNDTVYIDVNEGFTRLSGYTREEALGHSAHEINIWKNREERERLLVILKSKGKVDNIEAEFLRKDGTVILGLVSARIIQVVGESCILTDVRDITEQKKLQSQLMQSQKIQSIGTLAGGVAHDFNNILGIIFGYVGLLEKNRLDPVIHKEGMQAIVKAAERGAALVSQILTFARKTEVAYLPLSIPTIMRELLSMLKQTFPKTVTFSETYDVNLPDIMGDKTQIHQALLNLFVNARDAMTQGGSISIHVNLLQNARLLEKFAAAVHPFYVCIRISDTGCGMDEATRQRIFDPFFTTKDGSKGTGLGLSVAYGIVQSHQGFIDVESTVGKGTAFMLYLPATNIVGWNQNDEQVIEEIARGTETILIAEDEELLLAMVRFGLESRGYKVIETSDGEKALEMFARHHKEIELVLSDLGLPKMNGIDVLKKMKEIDPDVCVIVASGYFEPELKTELEQLGAKGFLMKPYKIDQLLQKIKEVLEQKKG
jgi:PAS domain S-box-containing protein